METFVYEAIEVKKTGRTAEKAMPGNKKMVLAEVTPVNEYDGTWKKWASPQALFEIMPDIPKEAYE